MASQQSSDLLASLSAPVIILAAYNIEHLINNIELSLLILLISSSALLLFNHLLNKKSASVHRSDIVSPRPNTNTAKKKAVFKTTPLAATTQAASTRPRQTNAIQAAQPKNNHLEDRLDPNKPSQWSLQLLQDMDWKHFEQLSAHFYESLGYTIKMAPLGVNKEVDIYLYKHDQPNKVFGIIKCKQWKKPVGIDLIKALFTVQKSTKTPLAVFFSATGFSKAAISFCEKKYLKLISGEELLKQIRALPLARQTSLLKEAVRGDYTTPSCIKCNAKMALQTSSTSGKHVWRCQHYPQCKTTVYPRRAKK